LFAPRRSVVPPTATTVLYDAGDSTPYPLSPDDAVIATPGWSYAPPFVDDVSEPPYELEITFAPSFTASFTAAARFANEFESASTRRILQFWQISCAVSTSSAISSAHPASLRG
jgi:hypothetical protein